MEVAGHKERERLIHSRITGRAKLPKFDSKKDFYSTLEDEYKQEPGAVNAWWKDFMGVRIHFFSIFEHNCQVTKGIIWRVIIR